MITDSRIAELMSAEVDMFVRSHPRSQEESTRSQSSLLAGVPMPWMKRWAGPFPVVADKAVGGSIVDIDGNVVIPDGERITQADIDQFAPGAPGFEATYGMYWWNQNIAADLPDL